MGPEFLIWHSLPTFTHKLVVLDSQISPKTHSCSSFSSRHIQHQISHLTFSSFFNIEYQKLFCIKYNLLFNEKCTEFELSCKIVRQLVCFLMTFLHNKHFSKIFCLTILLAAVHESAITKVNDIIHIQALKYSGLSIISL